MAIKRVITEKTIEGKILCRRRLNLGLDLIRQGLYLKDK